MTTKQDIRLERIIKGINEKDIYEVHITAPNGREYLLGTLVHAPSATKARVVYIPPDDYDLGRDSNLDAAFFNLHEPKHADTLEILLEKIAGIVKWPSHIGRENAPYVEPCYSREASA